MFRRFSCHNRFLISSNGYIDDCLHRWLPPVIRPSECGMSIVMNVWLFLKDTVVVWNLWTSERMTSVSSVQIIQEIDFISTFVTNYNKLSLQLKAIKWLMTTMINMLVLRAQWRYKAFLFSLKADFNFHNSLACLSVHCQDNSTAHDKRKTLV